VDATGIGDDIHQAALAEGSDALLLGRDHRHVLIEGAAEFAEKVFGRLRVVDAITVGAGPEVVAALFRFGCNRVEEPRLKSTFAFPVVVRAGVGGRSSRRVQGRLCESSERREYRAASA
jgi:hypothetical protein